MGKMVQIETNLFAQSRGRERINCSFVAEMGLDDPHKSASIIGQNFCKFYECIFELHG
jgi:hypothetical protein